MTLKNEKQTKNIRYYDVFNKFLVLMLKALEEREMLKMLKRKGNNNNNNNIIVYLN